MVIATLARWRRFVETTFPERHIYIRDSGAVRGLVLRTGHQLAAIGAVIGLAAWASASTYGMIQANAAARAIAAQAQANAAQAGASKAQVARFMAKHDAQLIATVDNLAQGKADTLRTTLRMAGVNPESVAPPAVKGGQGGPLIAPNSPRALAAIAPGPLANSMVKAARDISNMRALAKVSEGLPLAKPTTAMAQSSSFGVRRDPFTGQAAFHPGLDFPAPRMTPVFATAPGVVSFTGPRSGYGTTVEIEHGRGFKTRFAHLAAIRVKLGQKVSTHQMIGAIGSTGRSTGPHLHYEVWRDGQVQNPERFLKAGDYVQQAG